jgi:hypothetical protein
MQYSEVAVACYDCDPCDTAEFQVILTETTAFSAQDIIDEAHPDCTIQGAYDDIARGWLLDRECIEKYYTGGFDTGCKVCEFIEDPGICDVDPLLPAFFATRTVYLYYATLAGSGTGCVVRMLLYTQFWAGAGSTAILACENMCLQGVSVAGTEVYTTGDCCDYHDFETPSEDVSAFFDCETCDTGPVIQLCAASLAIAPPPPPGDPKYGTMEFIC